MTSPYAIPALGLGTSANASAAAASASNAAGMQLAAASSIVPNASETPCEIAPSQARRPPTVRSRLRRHAASAIRPVEPAGRTDPEREQRLELAVDLLLAGGGDLRAAEQADDEDEDDEHEPEVAL